MTVILGDIVVAAVSLLCMAALGLWLVWPRAQEWLT